ncbi:MAG: ATP-binding protein [Longimicrobiales bacterium]|nr:ATP-binding protein [Longimicrobiales bacterium]
MIGPLRAISHPSSVGGRLALLVVVLVVPLLSLLLWSGAREYRLLHEKANAHALTLADGTATATRQLFAGAEGVVTGLARRYGVRLLDPGSCQETLAAMNEVIPVVVNLLVADRDGRVVCSAQPGDADSAPESVADRVWFRALIAEPRYQVGAPHVGRITRRWVVPLAMPILGPDGTMAGVLGASVELRRLQDLLVGVSIGADDLVTIATADDVVLARSIEPDRWIGERLPGRRNEEVEVSPGRSLAPGTDLEGMERSWASVLVPELGWWVYAGVPEEAVWGPLRGYALRNLALALLVVFVAVVMAFSISRSLAASLTTLVERVRNGGGGTLPAALPAGAPYEVQELARQFDDALRETREMEERLRQSQKLEAVGQLAGGVAHDFNNILTVIQGNVDLLLESLPPGSAARREAREIAEAASRGGSLTRHLLTFSRRDRARARPLDLAALARGMERTLNRLLGEEVRWEAHVEAGRLHVLADPGHLEQVILNLVLNARDAVGPGGRVRLDVCEGDAPPRRRGRTAEGAETPVEAESDPGADAVADAGAGPRARWALLEVQDDGVGMDAETQGRIFEPFFTTKPRGRGTGLGLAAVFGIVEQMGWALEVESEPGRGSTFRIRIPLLPEEGAGPEDAIDGAPAVAATRDPLPHPTTEAPSTALLADPRAVTEDASAPPATLLLVEDEAALRWVAVRVLERAGYHVLSAADGREGLHCAEQYPGRIDLVVTDVIMPGLSGPEMAAHIAETHPDTPVLFTTGYTEDPRITALQASAPDRVLLKPFLPADLLGRVARILAR